MGPRTGGWSSADHDDRGAPYLDVRAKANGRGNARFDAPPLHGRPVAAAEVLNRELVADAKQSMSA
jgi:hypothetical protein